MFSPFNRLLTLFRVAGDTLKTNSISAEIFFHTLSRSLAPSCSLLVIFSFSLSFSLSHPISFFPLFIILSFNLSLSVNLYHFFNTQLSLFNTFSNFLILFTSITVYLSPFLLNNLLPFNTYLSLSLSLSIASSSFHSHHFFIFPFLASLRKIYDIFPYITLVNR